MVGKQIKFATHSGELKGTIVDKIREIVPVVQEYPVGDKSANTTVKCQQFIAKDFYVIETGHKGELYKIEFKQIT